MKRTARFASTTAAALLAATTLVACGGDSAGDAEGLLAQIEAGNVTLGTKYDQPGLGLREADGSMTGLDVDVATYVVNHIACLLYTSPSPRDQRGSRMPSSA